jgi:thiol-disulfide isomerase/thioredoxin
MKGTLMKATSVLTLILCLITGIVRSESPTDRAYQLIEENRFGEAMSVADSLIQTDGTNRRNLQLKYAIYDAQGDNQNALQIAMTIEKNNPNQSPWDCISLVDTYIKLSDTGQALNWLEKAIDRGFKSTNMLSDSLYDILRDQPRFQEFLVTIEKNIGMGLPAKEIKVKTLDGETFTLSEQRSVVIVDFWATWCGPCVREMPNLKKIYTKYHDGLEIIGISLDNSRKKLINFIEQESLPWKFSYSGEAWQDPDARNYGVNSIPSIWIIDKKGVLRAFDVRGEELEQLVAGLILE